VIWRRHLPIRRDDSLATARRAVTDFLDEAPPHLSEVLETYTWDVGRVLRDRAKTILKTRDESDEDSRSDDVEKIAGVALLESRSFVAAILSTDRKVERLLLLSDAVDVDDSRLIGRVLILMLDSAGWTRPGC
jgi:hypothetical protein